jgi:ABC-2 type transport system ATP-binding protein
MTSWGLFDVAVHYGPVRALDSLTLEIVPGSITAVVGGDGAGKTTALRTLVGVVAARSGEVRRPEPRSIGYMSAGSGIYRDLTVIENLSFAGVAYGIDRRELRTRSAMLLERTGLTGARHRLAGKLSVGMLQPLALVVAMIHSPDLLVLDEPTTGVDPVSRSELWRLIARAASDGSAVLVTTSYMDEAERASSVVVLSEGAMIASGTAGEIIDSVPGAVFQSDMRPPSLPSWRRGVHWHVWSPDHSEVPGATRIAPDIDDAVIVAELSFDDARTVSEVVPA